MVLDRVHQQSATDQTRTGTEQHTSGSHASSTGTALLLLIATLGRVVSLRRVLLTILLLRVTLRRIATVCLLRRPGGATATAQFPGQLAEEPTLTVAALLRRRRALGLAVRAT